MWRLLGCGKEDLMRSGLLCEAFILEAKYIFLQFFFLVYDVDEMKALGITLCLGLKIFKKSLLNFNGSFFID
jgi:hypothetical protein